MSLNPFRCLLPRSTVSDFIKILDAFYPKKYAASWDNVGLLLEPIVDKPLNKILLTNDLTENVCDEAIQAQVDLIISYHPPLFRPLKAIRGIHGDWKERIVAKCLRNDIAIYSPHTVADAILGGVNDYLLLPLEPSNSVPIEPDSENVNIGSGRRTTLKTHLSIQEITIRLKAHLKTDFLRVSFGPGMTADSKIETIAVCVGSGASILRNQNVNLIITGEMSHHEVLDIIHQNPPTSIILCEHSTSERAYLDGLAALIQEASVNVIISTEDREPLKTV